MSWTCSYEVEGYCKRLRKKCKPLMKGCVLDGKVKMIDEKEEENKNGRRTEAT